jgi:PleD family two-component response regulator
MINKDGFDKLISPVDELLYKAKKNGKKRVFG